MASGSFKSVYSATWKANGQAVAVLVLRGGADLTREIGIFEHLGNHPHLVKLLAVCTKPPSGEHCMVLEFAQRGSLDGVLQEIEEDETGKASDCVLLTVAGQVKTFCRWNPCVIIFFYVSNNVCLCRYVRPWSFSVIRI